MAPGSDARLPRARAAAALLLAATAARADYVTLQTRYSADPSPFVGAQDGRLYVTTTHDEVGVRCFCMLDYNVFSTDDGVNWRDDGIAFSPVANTTWGKNAWAQQVIWHAPLGKYVMYFPAFGDGYNNSVGVAAATDPRGPYVDIAGRGIAPGEDPTIFVDDDGTRVLCSATNQPYNMPWCGTLEADMVTWATPQRQVFIDGLQPGNFFEAPWIFKRKGVYYLSFMEDYGFSASVGAPFGWSLGYATNNSSDPLGNYTYRGPLMWANPGNCDDNERCADSLGSVGGNSHHGFVEWPAGSDQWYIAYHTRNLAVLKDQVTFSQRNVGLDRVYFEPDGAIATPVASTPSWVRQQKVVDAYAAAQPAAMMAAGSSLFIGTQPALRADPAGGMWRYLWNVTADSFLRVRGVDFGAVPGASGFTVRVASLAAGGAVEARLDGPAGALVATAAVPATGGWETFTNVSCASAGAHGLHDLFLVFRAPSGAPPNASAMLFNVMSWAFSGGAASGGGAPPAPAVRVALRSRATGLHVTAPADGSSPLTAAAATVGPAQVFAVVDNGDGSYALRAANGLFVAAATPGGALAASAASAAEPLAQWRLAGTPDGAYALLAAAGAAKGQMVVAGPGAGDALQASGKDASAQGGGPLFELEEQMY